MKILLSHRYFWPDTPPYATMLRSIAEHLHKDGHEVTVFTTQPSYQSSTGGKCPSHETVNGVKIVRMKIPKENKRNIPLRIWNVYAYTRGLKKHIQAHPDYDVVMASTFPPLFASRTAARASRQIGARFFYHCMDIHPEVSRYSGQLKKGRLLALLKKLDTKTCKLADKIIVLSKDMKNTLHRRKGGENLPVHVLNNFLPDLFENDKKTTTDGSASVSAPTLPEDKFTILFAGNIGNFQNLDVVIDAALRLADLKDVQFWFLGEGAAKKRIQTKGAALLDKTLFFLPHQPQETAQKMMGEASLNLVSLKPDIFHVSYPSKTLVSLGRGTPLLAIIEPESELARMVKQEKIGYTAGGEAREIEQVIRTAFAHKDELPAMRRAVHELYQRRFMRENILESWAELYRDPQISNEGHRKQK